MKFFAVFFAALLALSTAFAGEHKPATIEGTHIDLFERDHSFSGSIHETPVFGVFNEADFLAEVLVRKGAQTLTFKTSQEEKTYKGSISEARIGDDGKSTEVSTAVQFLGAKKTGETTGELTLSLDGQNLVVSIVGESFSNNHFHAPTYSAALNGQTVSFKFTGEACFGYSANLNMMILTVMAHLQK